MLVPWLFSQPDGRTWRDDQIDRLLWLVQLAQERHGDSMEAAMRDLGAHLSRYLSIVRDGQELTVTGHGKAVARLVPALGIVRGRFNILQHQPPWPVSIEARQILQRGGRSHCWRCVFKNSAVRDQARPAASAL